MFDDARWGDDPRDRIEILETGMMRDGSMTIRTWAAVPSSREGPTDARASAIATTNAGRSGSAIRAARSA